ncbi:MAG: ribosome maturation factor RimP [Thermoanaerobaculia bacterium]
MGYEPTFLLPADLPAEVAKMMSPEIGPTLQTQFEDAARQAGCELIHAEFKGGILRLVLDRDGGVDLGHCQTVSKQVSALLDVAEFDPGRYTLEVSSPGLNRQLYRLSDYRRFLGQRVRVTWRDSSMPTKRTVVARLEALDEAEPASVELLEEERSEQLQVRIDDIQIARLEPVF